MLPFQVRPDLDIVVQESAHCSSSKPAWFAWTPREPNLTGSTSLTIGSVCFEMVYAANT
jgi:hypothetical protein